MNSDQANRYLLLLVGLLAGFIAGYAIGIHGRPDSGAVNAASAAAENPIAPEYAWVVDGLTCPAPGCMNPLLTCQSEISRRIRGWVNEQLRAGRSGQELRQEIIATHGAAVLELQSGAQGTPPNPGR